MDFVLLSCVVLAARALVRTAVPFDSFCAVLLGSLEAGVRNRSLPDSLASLETSLLSFTSLLVIDYSLGYDARNLVLMALAFTLTSAFTETRVGTRQSKARKVVARRTKTKHVSPVSRRVSIYHIPVANTEWPVMEKHELTPSHRCHPPSSRQSFAESAKENEPPIITTLPSPQAALRHSKDPSFYYTPAFDIITNVMSTPRPRVRSLPSGAPLEFHLNDDLMHPNDTMDKMTHARPLNSPENGQWITSRLASRSPSEISMSAFPRPPSVRPHESRNVPIRKLSPPIELTENDNTNDSFPISRDFATCPSQHDDDLLRFPILDPDRNIIIPTPLRNSTAIPLDTLPSSKVFPAAIFYEPPRSPSPNALHLGNESQFYELYPTPPTRDTTMGGPSQPRAPPLPTIPSPNTNNKKTPLSEDTISSANSSGSLADTVLHIFAKPELLARANAHRQCAQSAVSTKDTLVQKRATHLINGNIADALNIYFQIQELEAEIRRFNRKAKKALLKAHNPYHQVGHIDLHGLRVEEAIEETEHAMLKIQKHGGHELHITTDNMSKSEGSVDILRGAIQKRLKKTHHIHVTISNNNPRLLVVKW